MYLRMRGWICSRFSWILTFIIMAHFFSYPHWLPRSAVKGFIPAVYKKISWILKSEEKKKVNNTVQHNSKQRILCGFTLLRAKPSRTERGKTKTGRNRGREGGRLLFLAGKFLPIVICSMVVFFCTQKSFQNTNIQCLLYLSLNTSWV